jgi:hypothetical protein
MNRRLTVAVVGLGIGRSHLQAYQALPQHFEIKAVCDLDRGKAEAAKRSSVPARRSPTLLSCCERRASTSSTSVRRPTRIARSSNKRWRPANT